MPWGAGSGFGSLGRQFGIDGNDRIKLHSFTSPHMGKFSIWFRLFLDKNASYSGSSFTLSQGNSPVLNYDKSGGSLFKIVPTSAGTTYWGIDAAIDNLEWNPFGFSMDGSSSTNDPTVYDRGRKKTVGSGLTQTGSDVSWSLSLSALILGGRSSLARVTAGLYQDFAIWNDALTDSEFEALYLGVPPSQVRPSALLTYWPLDKATGPQCKWTGNNSQALGGPGIFYDDSIGDPQVIAYRTRPQRRYFLGISVATAITGPLIGGSHLLTNGPLITGRLAT